MIGRKKIAAIISKAGNDASEGSANIILKPDISHTITIIVPKNLFIESPIYLLLYSKPNFQ